MSVNGNYEHEGMLVMTSIYASQGWRIPLKRILKSQLFLDDGIDILDQYYL